MTRRPDSNLPPPSQPWARTVDSDLRSVKFDVSKNAQDNKNSFDAINASLVALGTQIERSRPSVRIGQIFTPTNFSLSSSGSITRGTATIDIPNGATFFLFFATTILVAGTSTTPSGIQTIHQQLNTSIPVETDPPIGPAERLFVLPSLQMPDRAGTSEGGGGISNYFELYQTPENSVFTVSYATRSEHSGYVGTAGVTVNMQALFFYNEVGS